MSSASDTAEAKPLVAKTDNRILTYAAVALILLLATWLFVTLENARRGEEKLDPITRPTLDLSGNRQLPRLEMPDVVTQTVQSRATDEDESVGAVAALPRETEIRYLPAPQPEYQPPQPVEYAPPPYREFKPNPQQPVVEAPTSERIMAGRIANPEQTIVQGTLINAVLETALDSTRPGQARALVTKDVMSFDGSRVLIPRGSRIFGTYQSEVNPGQKRVLIEWVRLLTPKGISVKLNSPSADPLGRAGLRGKVDNHTLRRIGDALLGSVVELGGLALGRELSGSSVVILPSASQATPQTRTQIQPTIKVEQGTRVTVFVAVDLDFSLVQNG